MHQANIFDGRKLEFQTVVSGACGIPGRMPAALVWLWAKSRAERGCSLVLVLDVASMILAQANQNASSALNPSIRLNLI